MLPDECELPHYSTARVQVRRDKVVEQPFWRYVVTEASRGNGVYLQITSTGLDTQPPIP